MTTLHPHSNLMDRGTLAAKKVEKKLGFDAEAALAWLNEQEENGNLTAYLLFGSRYEELYCGYDKAGRKVTPHDWGNLFVRSDKLDDLLLKDLFGRGGKMDGDDFSKYLRLMIPKLRPAAMRNEQSGLPGECGPAPQLTKEESQAKGKRGRGEYPIWRTLDVEAGAWIGVHGGEDEVGAQAKLSQFLEERAEAHESSVGRTQAQERAKEILQVYRKFKASGGLDE